MFMYVKIWGFLHGQLSEIYKMVLTVCAACYADGLFCLFYFYLQFFYYCFLLLVFIRRNKWAQLCFLMSSIQKPGLHYTNDA